MDKGYVGNLPRRLLRHSPMRIPTSLLAAGLVLAIVVGACNDDTDVTAGDEPAGDQTGGDDPDGTVPGSAPDLVGTITAVTPFEPITQGCTPPDEVDPQGAVSSDDPPICTPEDNDVVGSILVEEHPDAPSDGRKVTFTVTSDSTITVETAEGLEAGSFEDLTDGQVVDTWVSGDACAESYPEQCGLLAVRVKA